MPRFLYGCLFLSASGQAGLPEGSIIHFDKELVIQIGIQWLNIILLTAVLVFVLYKPVKRFMAGRAERIHNEIEAARMEREKAQELKEKYEAMLEEIEGEREDILLQAHKKAMEKSDQLLFDARREADAMYSRALAELETERKNINDEMKKQIIELSVLMAGRFVEVSIDRETQDRYIEQALSEWEGG